MLAAYPEKMQAAVLHQPFDIRIETLDTPKPGPREALVKVMAVGVCGSDVHYYEHGRIGRYVVENPIVLGHECAGEVVAVGSEVTRVRVGDRVAIEPGVTCGACPMCKAGRYNLCSEVQFMATPPVHGSFAQYVAHREDFLFRIPEGMSYEEGALIEPFSVGIHAVKRAGVSPGSSVAIMGMGPVGLMAVVAAKAYGAGTIIAADREPVRLEAAVKLGATHAVQIAERDPVEAIRSWTAGKGADAVLETAGHATALQNGLRSVRRGGVMSVVGLPPQDQVSLDIPYLVDNEIDVRGIFRYANAYEQGIRFLASGIADANVLLTDKFGLEQTREAMERARTNKSRSLKVMVYPNG